MVAASAGRLVVTGFSVALFLTAVTAALPLPLTASGNCYTFYGGLCPGPANCVCTLGPWRQIAAVAPARA